MWLELYDMRGARHYSNGCALTPLETLRVDIARIHVVIAEGHRPYKS